MKEITDQKIKNLLSGDEVGSSSQNENQYQFSVLNQNNFNSKTSINSIIVYVNEI